MLGGHKGGMKINSQGGGGGGEGRFLKFDDNSGSKIL